MPFELDDCTLANNDDITQLLIDVANDSSDGNVYINAPTSNLDLVTDSIDWAKQDTVITNEPVVAVPDDFIFNEDATATLTLIHKASPQHESRGWYFENFNQLIIGGNNLNMTIQGLHPGLGNGNTDENDGWIEVLTNDESEPSLMDIRAHFNDTNSFGIYVAGGSSIGAINNRINKLNVSGVFWNSGVTINSGVQSIWFDPDNFKISDPYVRVHGWDGADAGEDSGRDIGCFDETREQGRSGCAANIQFADEVIGGVTVEYGACNTNIFSSNKIGNSAEDPYIVKYKDWGASGPIAQTGYPSGVAVKGQAQALVMKHDPLPDFGNNKIFRWIKFIEMTPDYGNGSFNGRIESGCDPGNASDNNFFSGRTSIWVGEASADGLAAQYITAYVHVMFENVTNWDFGPITYGGGAGAGPDKHICCEADRTFGHRLEALAGAAANGGNQDATMLDHITVTGEGIWGNVYINDVALGGEGGTLTPINNVVQDTNIARTIDIGSNAIGTVIEYVDFTVGASGREIIDIDGTNTPATIRSICTSTNDYIKCLDANDGNIVINGRAIDCPANGMYQMGELLDCSRRTGAMLWIQK